MSLIEFLCDRSRSAGSATSVFDEHDDHELRIVDRSEGSEPSVVTEAELQIFRVDASFVPNDLSRARLTGNVETSDSRRARADAALSYK